VSGEKPPENASPPREGGVALFSSEDPGLRVEEPGRGEDLSVAARRDKPCKENKRTIISGEKAKLVQMGYCSEVLFYEEKKKAFWGEEEKTGSFLLKAMPNVKEEGRVGLQGGIWGIVRTREKKKAETGGGLSLFRSSFPFWEAIAFFQGKMGRGRHFVVEGENIQIL